MAGKILTSKKSQIKIQEMSFMIIGIMIFFLLVLLFWLAVSLSGLRQTAAASSRANAILLAASLSGTPEFGCADSSSLCVDSDKLLALKNHPEYSRFWDVAGIKVEKVYPPSSSTIECRTGNYPSCTSYTIVNATSTENTVTYSSYISLCRREYAEGYAYQQCDLGRIEVTTFNV